MKLLAAAGLFWRLSTGEGQKELRDVVPL